MNRFEPKPSSRPWQRRTIQALQLAMHIIAFVPLAIIGAHDRHSLILASAGYFLCFGFILHAIESLFYFKERILGSREWIGGTLMFLAIGLVAAMVIPVDQSGGFQANLSAWFAEHKYPGFLIAYATLTFMVTYCVIGSATWPFVRSYYDDPDSSFSLCVPSGRLVIGLQIFRGLLATLAVLPLLAAIDAQTSFVWVWLSLLISTSYTFAIAPMLQAPDNWPLRLRVIHAIEIVCFAAIQTWAWCYFLTR